MLITRKLLGAAFVVALFITGAVPTQARERDGRRCEQRIHKAERNLQNAIRKHGERSRQAEQRRRELEEVREHCHRH
jgi:hypothetical protein